MQPTTPMSEGRDLRALLTIAWRRRWVVLIPAIAGLLAGILIGHPKVLRPVYRASAKLLLDFPQTVGRQLEGMVSMAGDDEQRQRIETLLQSNDFLLRVAEKTGLRDDPEILRWVSRSRRRYPDMTEENLRDLRITQLLRDAINAAPDRADRNIIVIRVHDYYPDRARLTAQELANGVIEANREAQLERVRSVHDFSLEQLVIYKQRLTDAEQALATYQRGTAVASATATALDPARTGEIQRLRDEANYELDDLKSRRNQVRSSLEGRAPNTAALIRGMLSGDWAGHVEAIVILERKYAEETGRGGANGTGGETYALMIARKFQELPQSALDAVSEEARGIPAGERQDAADLLVAEARVRGVRARIDACSRLIADIQASVAGTPRQELTVQRLQEDLETNRALYNAFVQQLASSQISEAFEATMAEGRLSIIEPPSRPFSPVKPNRIAIVFLSTTIGLLLGFGALVLVERQDQTYRDAREAERALGLKVLGALPQIDAARKGERGGRVVWTSVRLDEFLHDSPAYLELRRVVLQLRGDEETMLRSLLITSTRGGEGKTTCSILFAAAAAAEEPRTPVLLVDLDLRRGTLGRMLTIDKDTPGVVQALESRRIDESWFHRTSIPNLRVLALGSMPAPRNDLLTFENLSWLLPELTRRYGLVIIDSPPNLPVPDPLIIGQLVDGVLLVVKAGSTPRNMVERAVELQKQFTGNVRGILMNNMNESLPYYYNYRYYGYATRKQPAIRKEQSRG